MSRSLSSATLFSPGIHILTPCLSLQRAGTLLPRGAPFRRCGYATRITVSPGSVANKNGSRTGWAALTSKRPWSSHLNQVGTEAPETEQQHDRGFRSGKDRANTINDSDYDHARQHLANVFNGDSKMVEQELKWLKDQQRFDEGAANRSLRQLGAQRVEDIEIARRMDNAIALQNLLGPCYSLEAAKLELRWLQEYAASSQPEIGHHQVNSLVENLSRLRYNGLPLQYILKSEFFGDIKLLCHRGVLVPRQDTADHVMHLLDRLRTGEGQLPKTLKVLDLCCGSGCMGLLMAHSFPYEEAQSRGMRRLQIYGIDNSRHSIELAEQNRRMVLETASRNDSHPQVAETLRSMQFKQTNVLSRKFISTLKSSWKTDRFDIIISNPPYVSPESFEETVSLSVQRHEPMSALVPSTKTKEGELQSDIFYKQIISLAEDLSVKVLLLETGDREQSERQRACLHEFRAEDRAEDDGIVGRPAENLTTTADSTDIRKWARPLMNFGDSSGRVDDGHRHYGHRGFVFYTYRMHAAGWVGPKTPTIANDGWHYAI